MDPSTSAVYAQAQQLGEASGLHGSEEDKLLRLQVAQCIRKAASRGETCRFSLKGLDCSSTRWLLNDIKNGGFIVLPTSAVSPELFRMGAVKEIHVRPPRPCSETERDTHV